MMGTVRLLRLPVSVVLTMTLAIGMPAAVSAESDEAVLEEPVALELNRLEPWHGEASTLPSAAFRASEKMLLRMIPKRIRRTCVPRRSALPRGTVAAVQCRPVARVVRDMAYYLLDGGPATRVFEERRKDAGVTKGRRCVTGGPGVSYWIGGMPTSEVCYRNADRRANLRFLEPATRCRQLKVAGRSLKTPTVYVAVLGRDRNIVKLARWATDDGRARPSVLTQTIRQPGSRPSPSCPR